MGLVSLFLLSFLLLAPRIVRMEGFREKLIQVLSEREGIQLNFEEVELSYLPLPHLKITQPTIAAPGIGTGHLETLSVYPRLPELLQGKAELSRIELLSPRLRIAVPGVDKGDPSSAMGLLPLPFSFGSATPDLEVVVRGGTVDMVRGDRMVCSLRDLDIEATLRPKGLLLRLSCTSDLWGRLSLAGRIDPRTRQGQGQVDIERLRPHSLAPLLFPAAVEFGESVVNLGCAFKIEGPQEVEMEIGGSIPLLTVLRDGKEAVFKCSGFRGTVSAGPGGLSLSVKEARLEEPLMTVSGEYTAGRAGRRIRLEGREVDLSAARKTAAAFWGSQPEAAAPLDIVREGKVPSVTLQSRGATWDELFDLDRMAIHFRLEDGTLLLPQGGLDLEGVRGEAVIAGGVLEAKDLQARLGKATGQGGTLRLGLQGENAPFHLEIEVDADLAETAGALKRLVADKSFLGELEKIRNLQGRANGRLILGETVSNILARVDAHRFDLWAERDGIPSPVKLEGGRLQYEGTGLRLGDLQCGIGGSAVTVLSCDLQWQKEPRMAIDIKEGKIAIEEVFSWIHAMDPLRPGFKGIRKIGGEMILRECRIKGPVTAPDKWQFDTSGNVVGLSLETDSLPGPLRIARGAFRADPKGLILEEVQASMLDTVLNVSGAVHGDLHSLRKADLKLGGKIGTRTIGVMPEWYLEGKPLRVRSALSLESGRLAWEPEKSVAFKAAVKVWNGPDVSLDIRQDHGLWTIERILLKDGFSNLAFSCGLREEGADFSFTGTLHERTLDSIFEGYQFQNGWLKGDLQVHLDYRTFLNSWARGKLEAEGFTILHLLPAQVELNRVSLAADGDRVGLKSVEFEWADTGFRAGGSLQKGEKGLLMDMDVYSSILDWERVKGFIPSSRGGGPLRIPLTGSVRVHFGEFAFSPYTWRPFKAEAVFAGDKVEARITEANTCGLSTPGHALVTPEGWSFRFDARASGLELRPCIECFSEGGGKITGKFQLDLRVRGKGRESELLRSLEGNVSFSATHGRVLEHIMFQRILHFLSLTEVLRGKVPDLGKEGFSYDSIAIKGEIRDGRCMLREAVLDGVDMEVGFEGQVDLVDRTVNGRLLVAPFRTLDRIVNFIPLVRTIMGGTLVSIPIKVEGSLLDPKLTPLAPSAVGQSLMDMMKRTFLLPVEIFDPAKHR
jgi:hypothetical protein